ncbi:LytTR family DNA-binding domain-containing protein [Neolewinella persica]|uniref:LytTR family DNA-binding domain-containing protein n=1 Tax=Neolewinella persica TaxID=70998 RepID=UPI000364996B|nr:LytTR family DNA-binding domain-containing protein [Neolewinella persica]
MFVLIDSFHNERWLFRYFYPLTAIAVVHIGNENSLTHLLTIPSYYSDLLLALALSFGVGAYYHWWYKTHSLSANREKGSISFLLGYISKVLLIPVGTIIIFESLYVILLLDIPFSETSIIYLELPLVLLFCVLVNLVYGMLNYREKYQLARFNLSGNTLSDISTKFRTNFIVHRGNRSKNISVKEVAYFQVESKLTFLMAHDGRRYMYLSTLKDLEDDLDPKQFFFINRQVIAHRNGIIGCERTNTRRLEVHLCPATSEPVFVSKAKSGQFLRWLEGKFKEEVCQS